MYSDCPIYLLPWKSEICFWPMKKRKLRVDCALIESEYGMTSKLCVSRMAKKSTSTGCSLKRHFSWSSQNETEQGMDYSEAFETNKMKILNHPHRLPDVLPFW